ncbi:MAG: hypothetical protein HC845_11190 [Akkermansiaceae bacterium]|nr:hypothetical protein [Akkermansiaceae bacterium]
MQYVPLDRNPSYVNRLILAWINRATLSAEMQQPAEAEISFSNAAQLLISWGETTTPDRAFIASMFHTNRARFQLDQENPIAGWKDVHIAVNFLKNLPPSDAVTEASIKARGILCRALAMLLDEPGGIQLEKDWIATATDLNEEALGMARSSNDHSPWIADLVRYGAKIYRVCQPHFLGEYLKEWLAPGSPLAENTFLIQEMQHELQLAKANVEQITRQRLNDTPFVRKAIQTIQSLQLAERELALQSP